jgi:hypothetical protein
MKDQGNDLQSQRYLKIPGIQTEGNDTDSMLPRINVAKKEKVLLA